MKYYIKPGDKIGDFEVISEFPRIKSPSGSSIRFFNCRCICGKNVRIRLSHLVHGRIKSCGCLFNCEKHGFYGKSIHTTWRGMKNRVKENYTNNHLYFKKGISLCDNWKRFVVFKEWALQNGFKPGLQLDRIDNSKGYCPDNCRFTTSKVNCNNRDITFIVKYHKNDYPFMMLIAKKNLDSQHNTIRGRLKRGWTVEDAFDKPIRKGNYG